MLKGKLFVVSIMLLLITVIQGCSSATKLVDSWADSGYQGEKLRKFLVIGVVKDDLMRRTFEDQFVGKMTQGGHEAVASYVYMPTCRITRKGKRSRRWW